MKKTIPPFLVAFFLSLLVPLKSYGQDEFEFYSLRFGMTREEAAKLMPLFGDNAVKKPGHGMSSLELFFDREGLLIEIQASYLRPDDTLRLEGLRRALREKLIFPVKATFPNISVTLDEYGNRAALTLRFLSKGLREKNIEFYKEKFLIKMQ